MRAVRGFFGLLLILGGAFVCGLALLTAGGVHGWEDIRPERLLSGRSFLWTAGGAALTILGIALSRAGSGAAGLLLGIALALAAVAVGAYGLVAGNHLLERSYPYFGAAGGLALVAVVLLSWRS